MEIVTIEQQIELEKHYTDLAQETFKKRLEQTRNQGRITSQPLGSGLKKLFVEALATNIGAWIDENTKPKRGVGKKYRELLKAMLEAFGKDALVLNICATVLEKAINETLATDHKASVSSCGYQVGNSLYYNAKTEAYLKQDGTGTQVNRIQEGLDKRTLMYQKTSHIKGVMKKNKFEWVKWEKGVIVNLGLDILYILIQSTDLITTSQANDRTLYLEPSQALLDTYRYNAEFISKFIVDRTPTIVKPKPWTDMSQGGYYGAMKKRLHFMRISHIVGKTKVVKSYIRKIQDVDLSKIYSAVNAIQETPYRINKDMYEVINVIFEQGGGIAGIAGFEPHAPEPIRNTFETKQDFGKRFHEWLEIEIARRSKALRAMRLFRYAKEFKEYDKIYFPCNIDFRGRIYPIPLFNHQGDDFMKSLIEYAEPVPLKDSQDIELFYWQGANLWGNDKVSHREQVEWVKANHSNIVDSAKAPLDYLWWTDADEPLQFLAWTMEYVKSLEYYEEHKTYEGYSCPLVIAYDGTCSGLQHYSAMLRDEVGGSAVNLIDHERPADIYQQVADKVLKIVEKDATSGTLDEVEKEAVGGGQRVHFGTRSMAQAWLAHGVNRKVVKRNVMTLAYGSGQYGFQEQIYEDTTKGNPHFKRFEKPCAKYMAKLVWQEVQTTVVSATEGMKYLKALAKVLTKHGLPVNWWTPLGLPVQQQYLKLVQKSFRTRFGDMVRWHGYYQDVADDEALDANGQKNGIAPNFIHSLDSTHLMMVVNEAGLKNYTTIHDSFGTSLGEARHLQTVIREQLYKLYTEHSPLEEFRQYVQEMTGEDLSDIVEPPKGNLELQNILKSTFIFH